MSDTLTDPGNTTYNVHPDFPEKRDSHKFYESIQYPTVETTDKKSPNIPLQQLAGDTIKTNVPSDKVDSGSGTKDRIQRPTFIDNNQTELTDLSSDANRNPMNSDTASADENSYNGNDPYRFSEVIDMEEIEKFAGIKDLDHLVEGKEKSEIIEKLFKFFKENPNPPDEKVHALAEHMGADPDKLETEIYKLLSSFLCEGKSKDFNGEYDPEQLRMGIITEREHTTNDYIAEKIAKDHLSENPKYYTILKESGLADEL